MSDRATARTLPALFLVAGLAGLCLGLACGGSLATAATSRHTGLDAEPAADVVADGRYVMGTILEVELPAAEAERPRLERALERAFECAAELDQLLSRFDPESQVSQLNARAGGAPLRVDPRVREILALSRRGALATNGAFDVSAGPVIALWTRAASLDRLPDEEERERAVRRVGADRIRIDPDGTVALAEGMSIDLGGVAKGFALDDIARELAAARVSSGLLSFGQSSVRALGAPPGADAWRLLLRAPGGGFLGVVSLRDRALSVSSSMQPSSEIAGVHYGHVVDPRTGFALTERKQAAVVARSAALAEMLSTALLVLDEAEGRAVVAVAQAEAYVIDARGHRWDSPGWKRETAFEPSR